jgi:hypothetical protein
LDNEVKVAGSVASIYERGYEGFKKRETMLSFAVWVALG